MKNFFKLLNFELNRFIKLYIVLLITILVIQVIGAIVTAKSYMRMANDAVFKGGMTQHEVVDTYMAFSMMDVVHSMWFMGPIAIGVAALLFYLFFIWYRDWFARNTFIYRLLMLPTTRMNIFFAKAVTIMLSVLGLVAYQLILLHMENSIIKWIVPKVYREDMRIVDLVAGSDLSIILPPGVIELVTAYGLGFSFVTVMFTAILFERSFRLKGVFIGIFYVIIAFILFLLPFGIQLLMYEGLYLYPIEMYIVEAIVLLFIVATSLYISSYLLKNKVTV